MKRKYGAILIIFLLTVALCSCSVPSPDGVPKDSINPIADGVIAEPSFVEHRVTRLLYDGLSQSEQLFYRHFYNSVFAHPEYIAVPNGLDDDTVQRVFIAVKYDNPHLLCLTNSYKLMKFGSLSFICPAYSCSAKMCSERTARLTERVNEIVGNSKNQIGEFARELYLHDELVSFCDYDGSNTGSDAYDALVTGKSACTGYAMAMKLLLDSAGISSAAVSGNAGSDGEKPTSHMWLCVRIDGEWYHLDPTWNDPVGAATKEPLHAWFNVTDEDIAETHRDFSLPKNVMCRSYTDNFYVKSNLLCDGNNDADIIEKALKKAYSDGSDLAELKYGDADEMRLAATELFDDGGIYAYLRSAGYSQSARTEYSENAAMSVLYIYVR